MNENRPRSFDGGVSYVHDTVDKAIPIDKRDVVFCSTLGGGEGWRRGCWIVHSGGCSLGSSQVTDKKTAAHEAKSGGHW